MAAETLAPGQELWRHPSPNDTQMFKFLQHVDSKYSLGLTGYPALYQWSVGNVPAFWEEVYHFVGITASEPFIEVGVGNLPPLDTYTTPHVTTP